MSAMFANKEHNAVKNMPAYTSKHKYIVARRKAQEVANEIGGIVLENF